MIKTRDTRPDDRFVDFVYLVLFPPPPWPISSSMKNEARGRENRIRTLLLKQGARVVTRDLLNYDRGCCPPQRSCSRVFQPRISILNPIDVLGSRS